MATLTPPHLVGACPPDHSARSVGRYGHTSQRALKRPICSAWLMVRPAGRSAQRALADDERNRNTTGDRALCASSLGLTGLLTLC